MTIGQGELIAGRTIDLLSINGAGGSTIAVASTGVAYGQSFPISRGVTYMFTVKLGGSGTKAVTVELEAGSVRPATEGAADTTNFCVPDNKAPVFASITDTNLHKNPYSPVADGFARLKFTGTGANDASTVVSIAKATVIRNT